MPLHRKQRVWYQQIEVLPKAVALILRYFKSCEPIQSMVVELKNHLWSLVALEMTVTREMSSFFCLQPCGWNITWPRVSVEKVRCVTESICNEVYLMIILWSESQIFFEIPHDSHWTKCIWFYGNLSQLYCTFGRICPKIHTTNVRYLLNMYV